jgi:hypothetical protein
MYLAVLTISALNLLVVSGMFFFFRRDAKNRDRTAAEDRQSLYLLQSKLLEKIKGIEGAHQPRSAGQWKSDPVAAPGPGQNRIKTAIDKLNSGIAPDMVGRECGYSRSEMGIILASATLNIPVPGQSSAPLQ